MTVAPRARLGALAIPLILCLAGCGGGDDDTSSPTTAAAGASPASTATAAPGAVAITVAGGSVQGPSRHQVQLGEQVALRVTSDVADEVHVHGYDETAPVGPGLVADISFEADIPGTFEVELENAHRRLTTLEVRP